MNQQFFHIASINFYHEYQGGGQFDGFLTSYSAEAGVQLRNLQLLVKPFFGGFHLMGSDLELLKGEHDPILIRIYPKESLFFNFTDLGQEFQPNSKVFFFSDQHAGPGSGILHSGDFASFDDSLDVLNPPVLKELLPGLVKGEVTLRDFRGNGFRPDDFHRYFLDGSEAVIYAENGNLTRGIYKGNQGMEKAPFGIISLEPDRLYRSFRDSGTTVNLKIRFRSRKTFWKYILSDKVFDKFSRLTVIDSQNKEILFKEGDFEIQPAWKVRSFESEVAIPFNADFNPRFQLIEKARDENQAGKVIYKQLPKASPEQLFQLPTNKEILFSHIFI